MFMCIVLLIAFGQTIFRAKAASRNVVPAQLSEQTPVLVELRNPAGLYAMKINATDGLVYVWIHAGNFAMGCSAGDTECYDSEKPNHRITLTKGFWVGQTLVTQSAYQRVMSANPSDFRGEQLPVESVTWNQAKAYCETVGGRLPTEAEWEYAARAGIITARNGDLDAIAWYDKNSGNKTHAVGQKQPNAWGLYDIMGNVWEWVGDWYDETYYGKSPSEDPTGPTSGQYRIVRGGSYGSVSRDLRLSSRFKGHAPDPHNSIGFRCVRQILP